MEVLASAIIPVSPYHEQCYQHAVASVLAQTLPVELVVQHDPAGYGPSKTRNEAAKQAHGLFVIFLDADDEITPNYVETTIQHYVPGHYVYSDHFMDNEIQRTRDCLDWRKTNAWHGITTLFPRALFEHIGGFAEVPQAEDSEFYIRAQAKGICGIRAPYPLFSYGAGGRRSQDFHNQHSEMDREYILREFKRRNPTVTSCSSCPQPPQVQAANESDRQEGDILVETLYSPASYIGMATGRFYKRAFYTGHQLWVNPRDVEASPDMFRKIFVPSDISPDLETVLKLAQEAIQRKQTDATR